MYRILLADDEPIILSGLQSMLRWEDHGCTVAGTARNGAQALDFIEKHRPDIVICDITMPVLSGLELLERAAEEFPEVVFIMLTNHEEFDMARASLRHRAVEYLLKIDLDEEALAGAVAAARAERDRRRRLADAEAPRAGLPRDQAVSRRLLPLLEGGERERAQAAAELRGLGLTTGVLLAETVLDPGGIPNIAAFTPEERDRLFDFHRQLAEDAARKLFPGGDFALAVRRPGWLLLCAWGLADGACMEQYQQRFSSALASISQMRVSLLCTALLSGEELLSAREQLAAVQGEYALRPRPVVRYDGVLERTDYVEAARRYVKDHILERISVQDAASAVGITPNYLSSLFKRQLGQNYMDYVNAAKVEYACELLRDHRRLVYEVSHALGYDNAYYFSKVFKRYMGVTPTEYQSRNP